MKQRQVLIIEDEASLREIYTKILSDAGMKVLSADNGALGISTALKHHPDLLLVDVMLPDISGHDVVKKIRLDEWGKKVAVIFLTNRSDAESIVAAVEENSDEYIIKAHTTNQELLNKVRSSIIK